MGNGNFKNTVERDASSKNIQIFTNISNSDKNRKIENEEIFIVHCGRVELRNLFKHHNLFIESPKTKNETIKSNPCVSQ